VNVAWKKQAYEAGETEEFPISTADAMRNLAITDTIHKPVIDRCIRGATDWLEELLQRGLRMQRWKYAQDVFTDEIRLPMAAPLIAVESVKYYNAAGTLTTLATTYYQVDELSEPARVLRAPNQVWPSVQSDRQLGVEVLYTVGWAAVDDIPGDIIDALYLLIGDRYEHREQTIVGTSAVTLPVDVRRMVASRRVTWAIDPERYSVVAA
jgi:uncharacterized phiE125 gp8 family phage protein